MSHSCILTEQGALSARVELKDTHELRDHLRCAAWLWNNSTMLLRSHCGCLTPGINRLGHDNVIMLLPKDQACLPTDVQQNLGSLL